MGVVLCFDCGFNPKLKVVGLVEETIINLDFNFAIVNGLLGGLCTRVSLTREDGVIAIMQNKNLVPQRSI